MTDSVEDQDLARALDSVVASANANANSAASAPADVNPVPASVTANDSTPAYLQPTPATDAPAQVAPIAPSDNTPLDSIKKDAIVELRPLVGKLNVSPEDKFDTYLLLIRSTDDASLIAPAHEAAKAIADETRRAEALLDIIKEIDFLSNNK